MLLAEILEKDMENCCLAMKNDQKLKDLEEQMDFALDSLSDKQKLEVEEKVDAYVARIIRIVYLQGIKDYAELQDMLKNKDISELLDEIRPLREWNLQKTLLYLY